MANLNTGNYQHSIVKAFDETTESLKTTIVNAAVDVTVSALTDSIAIADASGNKTTTTVVGAKRGLDVNVVDITIDAANDSIAIKNGANTLAINADGSINVVGGSAAATEATLSALNTKVPSGLTVTANRLQVELPAGGSGLTNTELRATAVPVSLTSTTITNFPATQAVSGTVTANVGTTNGLALDATLTGGLQKSIVRGGAKGTTVAADVTSTIVDANTQALDVSIKGTPSVSVTNFPASQAVTGTFFQATQPVSGSVTANAGTNLNTSLLALDSTVAKDASLSTLNTSVNTLLKPASTLAAVTSITNTVTIKADTAINQANALKVDGSATTQPVSGVFFQATQPVSIAASVAVTGPLTDTQLRATAVPVSGTVSANATLSAETTKVIGTVNISSAQSVTANAGTNLNTSALALDTSVNTLLKPASTLAAVTTVTTVSAVTAITNALPTGTNSIGTVQAPAITKGTQGTTGVTVQDLKDAGRNQTNYFMALPVITTATDALQLLTGYKGSAAVVATATPAVVTTAKTYRINSISITYVAILTAGSAKFTLRANTAGVAAITSPAVANWIIGAQAAAAGISQTYDMVFPDGLEFAAGTGIGISMVGLSATQVAAAAGYGQITIHGYEY